jgi:hypothetical protein
MASPLFLHTIVQCRAHLSLNLCAGATECMGSRICRNATPRPSATARQGSQGGAHPAGNYSVFSRRLGNEQMGPKKMR